MSAIKLIEDVLLKLNKKGVFFPIDKAFLGSIVSQIEDGKELSPKQIWAVYKLLPKYQLDLYLMGVSPPSEDEVEKDIKKRLNTIVMGLTKSHKKVYMKFSYNEDILDIIKESEVCNYVPEGKYWVSAIENVHFLIEELKKFNIQFSDSLKAYLENK